MTLRIEGLERMLSDCVLFARHASGVQLRSYQINAARAIADSVIHARGLHFVVAMSRQSGKNETQAQIEAYLLTLLSRRNTEMVKASPTFKPQTQNAMRRLQRTLEGNALTRNIWEHEEGYIYRVGKSRIYFLSGQPRSNVVGATASALLECDEAQDVLIAKWDKDFAPMASSTNATIVFWGTVWTSTTLLAREIRIAQKDEARDGIKRYFSADAEIVGTKVQARAAVQLHERGDAGLVYQGPSLGTDDRAIALQRADIHRAENRSTVLSTHKNRLVADSSSG